MSEKLMDKFNLIINALKRNNADPKLIKRYKDTVKEAIKKSKENYKLKD